MLLNFLLDSQNSDSDSIMSIPRSFKMFIQFFWLPFIFCTMETNECSSIRDFFLCNVALNCEQVQILLNHTMPHGIVLMCCKIVMGDEFREGQRSMLYIYIIYPSTTIVETFSTSLVMSNATNAYDHCDYATGTEQALHQQQQLKYRVNPATTGCCIQPH